MKHFPCFRVLKLLLIGILTMGLCACGALDTEQDPVEQPPAEQTPEPEPEPVPDTTLRDNAEKAIVSAIMGLAYKYDALSDLADMQDITIPNLQALAAGKGVPQEEFGALITALTPYKWQLEAVTGGTWAECWEGLKSRFRDIMQSMVD